MKTGEIPIHLYYFYSIEENEKLISEFENILLILQDKGIINDFTPSIVDRHQGEPPLPEDGMQKFNIIICLLSNRFLAAKRLLEKHINEILVLVYQKKTKLLFIELDHCDSSIGPFDNLECLHPRLKPITSKDWSTIDQAFNHVKLSLEHNIGKIREDKRRERWYIQGFLHDKTPENFKELKRKYPHSDFVKDYEKEMRIKDCEERLQKILNKPKASDLINFIAEFHDVNQEFVKEILLQIKNILSNEDSVWLDASKNKSIELYLDYYRRFPEGKYVEEVRGVMDDFLKGNSELDEPESSVKFINGLIEVDLDSYFIEYHFQKDLLIEERLSFSFLYRYFHSRINHYLSIVNVLSAQPDLLEIKIPRKINDPLLWVYVIIVGIALYFGFYFFGIAIMVLTFLFTFLLVALIALGLQTTSTKQTQVLVSFSEKVQELRDELDMLDILFLKKDIIKVGRLLKAFIATEIMLQEDIWEQHPELKTKYENSIKKIKKKQITN